MGGLNLDRPDAYACRDSAHRCGGEQPAVCCLVHCRHFQATQPCSPTHRLDWCDGDEVVAVDGWEDLRLGVEDAHALGFLADEAAHGGAHGG